MWQCRSHRNTTSFDVEVKTMIVWKSTSRGNNTIWNWRRGRNGQHDDEDDDDDMTDQPNIEQSTTEDHKE